MYKCRECSAEYKEKVEYCDCGNNTFEYIEDKKPLSLEQKSQIVSIAIFVICIILALLVWAIPSPKPVQTKQTAPIKQQIPDINKIWQEPKIQQQPEVTNVTPTTADYAR